MYLSCSVFPLNYFLPFFKKFSLILLSLTGSWVFLYCRTFIDSIHIFLVDIALVSDMRGFTFEMCIWYWQHQPGFWWREWRRWSITFNIYQRHESGRVTRQGFGWGKRCKNLDPGVINIPDEVGRNQVSVADCGSRFGLGGWIRTWALIRILHAIIMYAFVNNYRLQSS